MYCKKCGVKNDNDAKFCTNCGTELKIKEISDEEKRKINGELILAKKNAHEAAIAGYFSAGITGIFAILGIFGVKILGMDGWALIDATIVTALAFGTSKYSRFCAISLFALFIIEKLYQLATVAETGAANPGSLLMAIIFLVYFWKGIKGAFSFHKLQREGIE